MDILSSDLPNGLLASISEEIYSHSVVLLKVWFDPPGVDNILQLGAGTLVEGPKSSGIVTAFHIARDLTGDSFLGLTTSSEGNDFKIHSSQLKVFPVGTPDDGEYGPDLAFIGLQQSDQREVAQLKQFYRLSPRIGEVLLAPPSPNTGVWVACGSPQERTRIDAGDGRFAAMAAFQLFCGFGTLHREFQHSNRDYLEIGIDNPGQEGNPATFQGMSGGGLWQVPIAITPGGQLIASRFLLSGVIFWRAPLPERKVLLRSHGRRALYDQLYSLI